MLHILVPILLIFKSRVATGGMEIDFFNNNSSLLHGSFLLPHCWICLHRSLSFWGGSLRSKKTAMLLLQPSPPFPSPPPDSTIHPPSTLNSLSCISGYVSFPSNSIQSFCTPFLHWTYEIEKKSSLYWCDLTK